MNSIDIIARQLQNLLPPGLRLDAMQNMWGETVWRFSPIKAISPGSGDTVFPDEDVFTTTSVSAAEAFARAARIGAEAARAVLYD